MFIYKSEMERWISRNGVYFDRMIDAIEAVASATEEYFND